MAKRVQTLPSTRDLDELKQSLKGQTLVKGEAADTLYREVLDRWNQVYRKDSNLVALVEDEEDISKVVRFVTKHDLDVAVVCGGHSHHGASTSHGVVIDLRNMRKVEVDKVTRTVKAQGGCLAKDVEDAAYAEGLSVVMGAVNDTGIGGLTTGGGVGWLTSQYGLVIDNLLSARVVLASGEIVNASELENEDLYWGIRGGGNNFGICSEFKYRAHDQGPVFLYAFHLVAIDGKTALMIIYSTLLLFPPDKLQQCVQLCNTVHNIANSKGKGKFQPMFAFIAPPGMPHTPGFMIFYDGPEDQAREIAAPLYNLGPIKTIGGMMPYPKVTEVHKMLGIVEGYNRYATSQAQMTNPMDEEIILGAAKVFQESIKRHGDKATKSNFLVDLRDYRLAASKPIDATAYANRYDANLIVAEFRWDDPNLDATMREESLKVSTYVRQKVKKKNAAEVRTQSSAENATTAAYANVSNGEEKLQSIFGANLPRLRVLKGKYDPDCVWDKWYTVLPAEANGHIE